MLPDCPPGDDERMSLQKNGFDVFMQILAIKTSGVTEVEEWMREVMVRRRKMVG